MVDFFESFEELQCDNALKQLFRGVMVEAIRVSRVKKLAFVNCRSDQLLQYTELRKMKQELSKQIFEQRGYQVILTVTYNKASQYSLEELVHLYEKSIQMEMKETDIILYHEFCEKAFSVIEDKIQVSCADDFLVRNRSVTFEEIIKRIFRRVFERDVEVSFMYQEKTTEKKKMDTFVVKREEIIAKAAIEHKEKELSGATTQTATTKTQAQHSSSPKSPQDSTKQRKYRKPARDPSVFYGSNCEGEILPIHDIQDEIGEVVFNGQIIDVDTREIKNEKLLIIFNVTDFTDSIACKIFIKKQKAEDEDLFEFLSKGNFIRVKGMALMDTYSHEISISSIEGMKEIPSFVHKKKDEAPEKRVELHAHTKMSDMDAVTETSTLVKRAHDWGHRAIAITDHGVVQGFTDAFHTYQKMNLPEDDEFKIIYGVEAYLVDDREETVVNENGQDFHDRFVVFDLETTGFSPSNNKIIEIGAVKIEQGEIVDRFSTFVNPEEKIPYRITQVTSITDDMVADAETIETVLPQFMEFCEGHILVAHNASFDYSFIQKKTKEQGIECHFTVVDTVNIARILFPELAKFKLNNICKVMKVPLTGHHRAVNDAEATAHMFLKMIERLENMEIYTLSELAEEARTTTNIVKKKPYYHAIILAQNEVGRINLYRMVSMSHLNYFYRKPRIPRSVYEKYSEGLIIGSACEAGELYQAILEDKEPEEIDYLCNFYDYYEIQPLGNNHFMIDSERYPQIQSNRDLERINEKIVELGESYNKLVAATCDVHFLEAEDEVYRAMLFAGQKRKDADDQPPLYFRTTEEMLHEFEYLGKQKAKEVVITNTNKIADMIEAIEPVFPDKAPPVIPHSEETLREICENKAHEMYGDNLPTQVSERLEKELHSIISNGYSVMYIIAQKLVWKSVEDGYLVGSRGSVGSSFAATMAGITEVNPLPAHYYCKKCHYINFDIPEVKEHPGISGCDLPSRTCPECGEELVRDGHDIPFETFLGFYGDKEPDIDLNFSGEYQSKAHAYTEVIFGDGQTFRAGTIGTIAEKTAFGYVKAYYEEKGIHKRNAEIARMQSGCEGVRRSTGQHPGGIIVLPFGEEIYKFTPVQHPANDQTTSIVTTHFDYHSIDHNLLKLDILGHDDPTMIRMLQDLTGVEPTGIPLDDEKVISLFESPAALGVTPEDLMGCDLGSLGLPELGTDFVLQMLRDTKPKNFSDIVRISGLSHGTDVWLNNAQYYIKEGYCTLENAICTRDDIMVYLISMGVENGLAFKIMESVRKGRGLTEDMEKAMKEQGVEDWYIESCKKIKYMFPKAHAVAYVMMAFRVAFFKVYYPLAYYAAYFSIRATAFDYEIMCQGKEHLEETMRDYQRRENELSQKEQDCMKDMKIVQEMYARGYEFVPIDIFTAYAYDFQIVDDKLMPAICTIEGMGGKAAEGVVEAVKDGEFTSRENFRTRAKVNANTVEKMGKLGLLGDLPESDQMSLADMFQMA